MRLPIPILALMMTTLLTVPALAANIGGNGSGGGGGNGSGNAGGAATGGGNSNADKKVTKVPKDDRVAREAVKKHEVLPLEAVTALVAKTSTGRVLDVQLVRYEGIYVYEVTVLEADGRLRKLYFNARSGALMDPR